MCNHQLAFVADVAAADWLAPRLGPFGGWVGSVVPQGFESYARIMHPVNDAEQRQVRWSDICSQTGRTAHPLMQWHAVAVPGEVGGRDGSVRPWDGEPPATGRLASDLMARLCAVLARFTTAQGPCVMGLWDGHGWIPDSPLLSEVTAHTDGPDDVHHDTPPRFSQEITAGSRLHLPGRDYILFSGPIYAAVDIGWSVGDSFFAQSPNLMWPADESWCVATEIDFDSTLVAGPRDLIAAVLGDPFFDAWPLQSDDDLSYNGDLVNVMPDNGSG